MRRKREAIDIIRNMMKRNDDLRYDDFTLKHPWMVNLCLKLKSRINTGYPTLPKGEQRVFYMV